MKFLSTFISTILMASTLGTVNAFILPSDGQSTAWTQSFTGLPCNGPQCDRIIDIYYAPKTFAQNPGTRDTSLATRDSSLAIRNSSLALRGPAPDFADSTTTTTITTPIVTVTMSCFGSSFTPVDGTTYHCSTTIPPPVSASTFNSISSGVTIMSNGTPAATITSPEHSFTVMPAPSITSARPFVTISNASTTIIMPSSNLTSSKFSISSPGSGNTTVLSTDVPVITSTSLITVDPPSESNTVTSGTSTSSSTVPSAPSTNAARSSGRQVEDGCIKLENALMLSLTVSMVLATIL